MSSLDEPLKRHGVKIITLCGSTRFKAAYIDLYQRLTDIGYIVLTVGRFLPRHDHDGETKAALDRLHLEKINLSDGILVINIDGYVGESTSREIYHARTKGISVYYLHQLEPDYVEPALTRTDIGLAACAGQNEEVCQILGRALHYPRYCDSQDVFPGSTDEDGVCVGEHVAESIAAEAANRITSLERQILELKEILDPLARKLTIWFSLYDS